MNMKVVMNFTNANARGKQLMRDNGAKNIFRHILKLTDDYIKTAHQMEDSYGIILSLVPVSD